MADFITLACPTCGGKLRITADIDRLACSHCGNEHIVKRGEGVIAIQPLAESLTGLKREPIGPPPNRRCIGFRMDSVI